MIFQQIAPDNLLPEIRSLLGDEIGNVAKVATVLLFEQKINKVIGFTLCELCMKT